MDFTAGLLLWLAVPFLATVALSVCIVFLCCKIWEKCKGKDNRRHQSVTTITAANVPLQTLSPARCQASNSSYQPVPFQSGHGDLPNPKAAPPSYWEAILL